jgi:hypothetical protein
VKPKDGRPKLTLLPEDLAQVVDLVRRNLEEGEEAVRKGEYTERHRLYFRECLLGLLGWKEEVPTRTRPGRPRKNDKVVRLQLTGEESVDGALEAFLECLDTAEIVVEHHDRDGVYDILPPYLTESRAKKTWAANLVQSLQACGMQATVEDQVSMADARKMFRDDVKKIAKSTT